MAVLNLTPDSFSDGGRYFDPGDPGAAEARAHALVTEGADLIDIGAESTRPGARLLDEEEEWARLQPLLARLGRADLPVVLSLDTRHAGVAGRAADLGVRVLNLPFPAHLVETAPGPGSAGGGAARDARKALRALLRRFDATVLMHSRGTPSTMQRLTVYDGDLCQTVATELSRAEAAIVGDDAVLRARLIFDPGLGFAKEPAQSFRLLGQVGALRHALGRPVLVGASRKSMLGWATGLPVEERLVPSVVAAALAAYQGADIVRVHDVAATRAALRVCEATAARPARPVQIQPETAALPLGAQPGDLGGAP